MHELAITECLVTAVCESAAGRRVHEVLVEVGALSGVVPDALEFCYELATEGTIAEGSDLRIRLTRGVCECRSCGTEFVVDDYVLLCPCGSADVIVRAGRELSIVSIEVGEPCVLPVVAENPTAL